MRRAIVSSVPPRRIAKVITAATRDRVVVCEVELEGTTKKPTVSFRHFGGSGPLSAYWYPGPYGDAVEAKSGSGVGWFAPNGELLGVEFDDVSFGRDQQALVFESGERIEVKVARGKVSVQVRASRRNVA